MNFLKVLTQLNVVVNKYNVSFVNNHYGHVIPGDLNIVKNKKLCQVSYKDPTYQKPKQIDVEEALEEMQTWKTKASTRTIFQNGKVMLCYQYLKKNYKQFHLSF